MGDPKAETGELFHGLRPSSRKVTSKPIASPAIDIANAEEKPKKIAHAAAADRVDDKATCASSVEAIKSEILSKMATLEASLLTELQESRSREAKLRSKLARSRVATKDLQAKLTNCKYDHAQRQLQVIETHDQEAPLFIASNCNCKIESESEREHEHEHAQPRGALIASRARWRPAAALSCCADLRQLARNQVIRSVQDLSPEFTVDLQVHSYGGYIPWPKVLQWLEEHPEMVNTLGLNLQALRTI